MPESQKLRHVFTLVSDLEEPLNQALAFAHALDLMGQGLHNVGDDLSAAVVMVAETQIVQLAAAKELWQRIMAATTMPKRHA